VYLPFSRSSGTKPRQDNSVCVPSVGQIDDSNSANNSQLNALPGLDALLQVLQNANTSSVVSNPSPSTDDFSRTSTGHAVQVAATALNQLSQQEVPDTYCPFDEMIQSVCPFFFPREFGYQYEILVQFRGFGTPMPLSELQLECHFPNQKITTFLLSYYFDKSSAHWIRPVIHRPYFESYYRTISSGSLPPSLEFIALLAITCATALQFLPETDEDVRFTNFSPEKIAHTQRATGNFICRLSTREEGPPAAACRLFALHAVCLYRIPAFVAGTHSNSHFIFAVPICKYCVPYLLYIPNMRLIPHLE
jgi:hypothetical protein